MAKPTKSNLIPAQDQYPEFEHYAGKIEWDDNGNPKAVGVPIRFDGLTDIRLRSLMQEALNLPYDGKDPRYRGLTKGEAMIMTLINDAASGDQDARKELLDRFLGKPIQNIKSVSVKATLEEFLDNLAPPPGSPQAMNRTHTTQEATQEATQAEADEL